MPQNPSQRKNNTSILKTKLTLERYGGLGCQPLSSQKSAYELSTPKTLQLVLHICDSINHNWEWENIVFDPWLVESIDVKLADTKGYFIYWKKKSMYKWTHKIQTCVVEGSTIFSCFDFQLMNRWKLFLYTYI